MASMRTPHPGLGAAAGAGAQLLRMLLQNRLTSRRQQEDDVRAAASQELTQGRAALPQVESGEMSPEAFGKLYPGFADRLGPNGMKPFIPSEAKRLSGLAGSVSAAKNPADLPTEQDLVAGINAKGIDTTPGMSLQQNTSTAPQVEEGLTPPADLQDSSVLPSSNWMPTSRPSIAALMQQRAAKAKALQEDITRQGSQKGTDAYNSAYGTGQANEDLASQNADAVQGRAEDISRRQAYGQATGQNTATAEDFPAWLQRHNQTGAADTQTELEKQRGLTPILVSRAGQSAGAEAAATFPWSQKLAQTRADVSLMNQKEMDDYRNSHPKATADMLTQRNGAVHALSLIDEVKQLESEMDRRGMMGPLAGNAAKFASGKIKTEDLFHNPDDAQLAAEYFSEMGLLQKLAARVHGGARAAASPAMDAIFSKIVSGVGDKSIVNGQLDAVANVMNIYKDNPGAPTNINIPGAPIVTNLIDPRIAPPAGVQELLNR